jgi:hypothetical protein
MPPLLLRLLASVGMIPADRLCEPLRHRFRDELHHLFVDVPLWVERSDLRFHPHSFRVDSGATVTRIHSNQALAAGLPVASASPPVVVSEVTAAGRRDITIRRGIIRVRLHERQRSAPFSLPICYVVDAPCPIPLLGLGGVVDQMRWVIDGRWSPAAPHGYCLLKDSRRARDRFPG